MKSSQLHEEHRHEPLEAEGKAHSESPGEKLHDIFQEQREELKHKELRGEQMGMSGHQVTSCLREM